MIPALVAAHLHRVAFTWRARFPIVIRPFAITVTDSYVDGDGRLDVRMLGRTLQREEGPEMALDSSCEPGD